MVLSPNPENIVINDNIELIMIRSQPNKLDFLFCLVIVIFVVGILIVVAILILPDSCSTDA